MITLASDNPNPPTPSCDFQRGHDVGYGRGIMDRCSGSPHRPLDGIADTDYNNGYALGYAAGWHTNEVNHGNGS